jgi:hypothetical protein
MEEFSSVAVMLVFGSTLCAACTEGSHLVAGWKVWSLTVDGTEVVWVRDVGLQSVLQSNCIDGCSVLVGCSNCCAAGMRLSEEEGSRLRSKELKYYTPYACIFAFEI